MQALAWRGGAGEVLAWARERTRPAAPQEGPIAEFVLEAQLAALGALRAPRGASARPAPEATREDILSSRLRAVVVEAPDAARCGRFVEDVDDLDGCATFVVDGPMFARRVDVVAGDIIEETGRARLVLGLRGC